ncbi:MAG: macro domain-containing protein [Thermodesulfovibrionales bacterium]|nr:macro domain-containing protein [Thermodesulfovibrionales bacterium]
MKEIQINNKTIRVTKGDITDRDVDAIVNAANSYLQHGGGVALAIVKKGGDIIQQESDKIGFCPVGSAVITSGGKLKARFVIHTVGPKMGEGDEENKLASAIKSVLTLAHSKGLNSISVPAISTGIYGFPKDRCARILIRETKQFFNENPNTTLKLVEFCLFDDETYRYFEKDL